MSDDSQHLQELAEISGLIQSALGRLQALPPELLNQRSAQGVLGSLINASPRLGNLRLQTAKSTASSQRTPEPSKTPGLFDLP